MSSKMDRQGVRTPGDIERKYALGQVGTIQASIEGLKEHVTKTLEEFMTEINSKFEGLNSDYKVTFLVDGSVYHTQMVTKNGTMNAPPEPTSGSGVFNYWQDAEGHRIAFPYKPEGDIELYAVFIDSHADKLYTHFGIDKTNPDYKYIVLQYYAGFVMVYFCKDLTIDSIQPTKRVYADGVSFSNVFEDNTNCTDYVYFTKIISAVIARYNLPESTHKPIDYTTQITPNDSVYYWSNKPTWIPSKCKGYTNFT